MSTMHQTTRRHRLRAETRDAHEALDALVGDFDTLDRYKAYLLGMSRFRLPVEAFLKTAKLPEGLSGWQPKLIGGALARDLRHFGFEEPEAANVERPASASALYGLLYVLEGSSLGARLLVKRAETLGLSEENGAAHLFLQAGNISTWQTFVDLMANATDFDEGEAATAANHTFEIARSAFSSALESR